jgi:hypothetical protein
MKKIYLRSLLRVVSIILFSLQAVAQAPQTMTYQSVLRNSSNNLLANTEVGTKISLLQGTVSGTVVYAETQTTTTNANGLLSLQIGTGTVITGVFADIDWANGLYFIKTETDPTGGSSYTIAGTQQMGSVPYALFAAKSGDAIAGPQGPIGLTGTAGSNGNDGATGAQGIQGLVGETGATGQEGIQGLIGLTGVAGSNGETGARGLEGQQGLTGETGPQGIQGDIGLTGATGVEGPQGLTGPEGIQGDIGLTGATGLEGLRGLTGATGTSGNNGAQGIQGIMGLTGPAGPAGTSLSGGSQLIQGLTGATGPQGSQGIQGGIGLTGPTGPEGIQGLTGATGSQGIQGDRGLTGATGPQGVAGLTGAQGLQGLTGLQGIQGDRGLTGVTGLTGANGTNGSQGIQGVTGATGPQGIQGVTGAGYSGIISATSVTPANIGTIVLTTNLQGAFKTGDRIRVVNTASNYFEGILTITSGTSFSIVADYNIGTTAASLWTVSLTGVRGVAGASGASGAAGANGTNGTAGATGATGSQGIKGDMGLIAAGTVAGQMNYWNGTAWVTVAPGTRTQTLTYCDGVPTWGPCLPGLTTTSATAITGFSANSGGSITIDNGEQVTARGVCWSTTTNPTIALSTKTSDGTGNGTFTISIAGLQGATLYYLRAYATNSVGTSYGAQQSFTTLAAALATLSTTAITQTVLIASSGGNIANDGGAAVSSRGICWGTIANPTIALATKTTDGAGSGIFTSSTTGLNPGTLYYVRAYATNSAGTSYGNQQSFTSFALPTLTTTAATNVAGATAISGGSITNDGGTAVTSRGVCWSTTANPTIALSTKTINGASTGVFTSSIIGLTVTTLYHVRAYATNNLGTTYGPDLTFTTNTIVIGATYNGGIIAYIDATGIHGLIAATTDIQTATFGCSTDTTFFGLAIGVGAQNTASAVSKCAFAGSGPKLCSDLVLNGYTDWHLPSKDELNKLYLFKGTIGGFSSGLYMSSSGSYTVNSQVVNGWSTPVNVTFVYSYNFGTGEAFQSSRGTTMNVRAVRPF